MAIGWIDQKRRYRQYKARTKQLPANYHAAIDALERYLTFFGPTKGDSLLSMLEDLADLFEHPEGQWISRERERLTNAIERAAGEGTRNEERAA
jgi:DNA-binding ferritin-like protein (Dps family)